MSIFEPDPVLRFIASSARPMLAAEGALSEARDRVARLEAELVAARLEVEIAERKHRAHHALMADALDLHRERREAQR